MILFILLSSVVGCFVDYLEDLFDISSKSALDLIKKVTKMVSRRGLGEVLGTLGVPFGRQGGSKSGFLSILGAI